MNWKNINKFTHKSQRFIFYLFSKLKKKNLLRVYSTTNIITSLHMMKINYSYIVQTDTPCSIASHELHRKHQFLYLSPAAKIWSLTSIGNKYIYGYWFGLVARIHIEKGTLAYVEHHFNSLFGWNKYVSPPYNICFTYVYDIIYMWSRAT